MLLPSEEYVVNVFNNLEELFLPYFDDNLELTHELLAFVIDIRIKVKNFFDLIKEPFRTCIRDV